MIPELLGDGTSRSRQLYCLYLFLNRNKAIKRFQKPKVYFPLKTIFLFVDLFFLPTDVSRQTIDLTQMASSASSPSITRISYSPSPSPSQSSNPAPSRISPTSPVMPRVSQYELSTAGGGMQMEGASQLLSNMQRKLKRALTSVKSGIEWKQI